MNKSNYLFYEDSKKLKVFLWVVVGLLYFGALAGWLSLLLIWTDVLENTLLQTMPEEIIYRSIVVVLAVSLNLFVVKSKRLNYFIAITEAELVFNINRGSLTKYSTKELQKYEIVEVKKRTAKFEVLLTENRKLLIVTRKSAELKMSLDYLLLVNKKPTAGS